MNILSVNCNEQLQGPGTGIDVYGTVEGAGHDLALRQGNVILNPDVSGGPQPVTWVATNGPAQFDGGSGATVDAAMQKAEHGRLGSTTCPEAPVLTHGAE